MKSNEQKSAIIGITMGCPVGIGPEIILKLFHEAELRGAYQAVVLGDIGVLKHTAANLGISVGIVPWFPGTEIVAGTVPVMELSSLNPEALRWGQPEPGTGTAMATYIERGVQLASAGDLAALVTCPIAKSALKLAGYNFPGHTEMLAKLTATPDFAMMMAGPKLKVVLVTIHEPLRHVPELLTEKRIADTLRLTVASLRRDFGIGEPRVAVAALNPHGGEEGMFGREEIEIIGPAVANNTTQAKVSGPWPPDTVFHRMVAGDFDAVVAMYHDQGLIPFKLLHFSDGVNVTIGLPIVRTSVDHGTAYDIAGQNRANASSLRAAFELAALMATNRRKRKGE